MCTSVKAAEVGEIVKGLFPSATTVQLDTVAVAVDERLRSEHRTAFQLATLYALEDVVYDLEHSPVVSAIEAIKERAKSIRDEINKRAEAVR